MPKYRTGVQNPSVTDIASNQQPGSVSRSRDIRQWHINQAIAEARPSCFIHVGASECGQVESTAYGIEPEHAPFVIVELLRLAEEIKQAFQAKPQAGNVTTIRRKA